MDKTQAELIRASIPVGRRVSTPTGAIVQIFTVVAQLFDNAREMMDTIILCIIMCQKFVPVRSGEFQ